MQRIISSYMIGSEDHSDDSEIEEREFQRVSQIFSILTHVKTFERNFKILQTLEENPNSYLSRNEIENILSNELAEDEVNRIKGSFKRLLDADLLIKKSNRYHLSLIGSIIVQSITKIRSEIRQPLLAQLDRKMLFHSIYEGKGIDIKSDKHILQIGFLIKEIINELIEQDQTLEWTEYLKNFQEIIDNLDRFSEYYKDDLFVYNQLLRVKSEIESEFEKYHKAAQNAYRYNLTILEAGIDPKDLKYFTRLINDDQLVFLSKKIEPIFGNTAMIETAELWKNKILMDQLELKSSEDYFEAQITTIEISQAEFQQIKNDFIPPEDQLYSNLYKFLKEGEKLYLSEIINKLNPSWEEITEIIGYMPAILNKEIIIGLPLKSIKIYNNIDFSEGLLKLDLED